MPAPQPKTEALRRLAQGSRRVIGFGVRAVEGGWNRSKSGGVGSFGRQVGESLGAASIDSIRVRPADLLLFVAANLRRPRAVPRRSCTDAGRP